MKKIILIATFFLFITAASYAQTVQNDNTAVQPSLQKANSSLTPQVGQSVPNNSTNEAIKSNSQTNQATQGSVQTAAQSAKMINSNAAPQLRTDSKTMINTSNQPVKIVNQPVNALPQPK